MAGSESSGHEDDEESNEGLFGIVKPLHIFQECAVVRRIDTGELRSTVFLKQSADFCRVAFAGHIRQYYVDILQLQFRLRRRRFLVNFGFAAKLSGQPVGSIVNNGSSILELFYGHGHIAHFAHDVFLLTRIDFVWQGQ